jgi:hypothetical protein
MVAITWSPESRASTRLLSWSELGGVGSAGDGPMGLVDMGVAVFLVTRDVPRDVPGDPMVGEMATRVAFCGDAGVGSTLLSSANLLVVSLT